MKNFQPNYANENLNIGLPIFSIHGNHDPPSANQEQVGMMDLLKVNNYINYFGKYLSDAFTVEPIIL